MIEWLFLTMVRAVSGKSFLRCSVQEDAITGLKEAFAAGAHPPANAVAKLFFKTAPPLLTESLFRIHFCLQSVTHLQRDLYLS
jgi:hypothetical protein